MCVLTPWPRFVPGTSEAVQACESPVGMQGHGLPRPHPAFVGSDEFPRHPPRHPPWRGWQNSAPRPPRRGRSQATARPAASVAVSGAAGPPGCGAVQAQSDEGGRPHPCREAAPSWVGMFLGFWGQFQNQHKGWEGGWRRNPGPRDWSHSAPPQSDPQAELHTQAGGELMGAPGCHRDARWPSRVGGATSPPCQALGQEQGPREDQASGPGLSAMGEKGTSLGPPSG